MKYYLANIDKKLYINMRISQTFYFFDLFLIFSLKLMFKIPFLFLIVYNINIFNYIDMLSS